MITLWRVIKNGLLTFLRNGVLSFASTTVMVLTLLSLSTFFIINVALNAGIDSIKEKIDLSAYLVDEAPEKDVLALQNEIANYNEVITVKYVSKDEALERYKEQNVNNQKLIESLEGIDNPLPASIEVKVTDPTYIENVASVFDREEYEPIVNKVSYKENKIVIDKLVSATNFIQKIGIAATLAFATISLVIIFNTIRIAVFSQKDDIEIMKLVGATNWYIRGPFILEGALYGIIGTLVSMIALAALLYYSSPSINQYFGEAGQGVSGYLRNNVWLIFIVQLGIGIAIGVLSSWLALNRYFKRSY
jgi:cell division transport system permease protein